MEATYYFPVVVQYDDDGKRRIEVGHVYISRDGAIGDVSSQILSEETMAAYVYSWNSFDGIQLEISVEGRPGPYSDRQGPKDCVKAIRDDWHTIVNGIRTSRTGPGVVIGGES